MISKRVKANEIEIQVYESGNKTLESILFLHPQGSSSQIWGKAVPFFEENYHVILMDLRGHGETDKSSSGYDIQSQCKDIMEVLERLGKQKTHLVGNSLGGDIATTFASLNPEHVISLTNIDSGMIDYIGEDGERNLTKEQVIEEFKNRPMKSFSSKAELLEYAESVIPKEMWASYFEEWFKFVSLYEVQKGRISYQIPPSINVQIMDMVCGLRYKDLYKNITCPILFLPAEKEDHLALKLKNIEEAKRHTFVKTCIIPGSRHLMPLDLSEKISHTILEFFQEIRK